MFFLAFSILLSIYVMADTWNWSATSTWVNGTTFGSPYSGVGYLFCNEFNFTNSTSVMVYNVTVASTDSPANLSIWNLTPNPYSSVNNTTFIGQLAMPNTTLYNGTRYVFCLAYASGNRYYQSVPVFPYKGRDINMTTGAYWSAGTWYHPQTDQAYAFTAIVTSYNQTTLPQPTSIQLWLNNFEENISLDYGASLNSTAKINITGLWIAIEKTIEGNSVLIANGTTTSTRVETWSADANPYNITAYYSGNASYSNSSKTLWATIMKAGQTLNLSFNTSDSITEGTIVNISCADTTTLYLYNDTDLTDNPFILDTSGLEGDYNYTCNTTGNQNYTSASINRTLTVTIAPINPIVEPIIVCFKIKPICIKLSDFSIYLMKENKLIEWLI